MVRATLHQMAIRVNPPVRVQLADASRLRGMGAGESGMVGGLTVVPGRQVVEVYIAAGLPELEFGSTVAHEIMHVWMAQQGIAPTDRRIAEGLCQVVSFRWLRDQPDPLAPTVRERLNKTRILCTGDGFRMVRDSVNSMG